MYVTRRLSQLIEFPNSVLDTPEGPNSGYLVIKDEESETYSLFGLLKNHDFRDLPFPQNKDLTIRYSTDTVSTSNGKRSRQTHTSYDKVVLIPVLNQPLSSNCYYVIKPDGRHKGEAYACSTDEDMAVCCFCSCIQDVKPRPFNTRDIHQQYHICLKKTFWGSGGSFFATSVAHDAYPPSFLRKKGWQISGRTPKNYELNEATGINASLRACLPQFGFPLSDNTSESVVVGKWYCPFMFIKDGILTEQVKKSRYYEMTLEQKWEKIFSREYEYGSDGNKVMFDVPIQKEVARVNEGEAVWDDKNVVNGVVWFKSYGNGGHEMSVGLSVEIVERIKWEEERSGWFGGNDRVVNVKKTEESGGTWMKFGCYVLVETFVLRRMDKSIALTYDFKHIHQLRCKWE